MCIFIHSLHVYIRNLYHCVNGYPSCCSIFYVLFVWLLFVCWMTKGCVCVCATFRLAFEMAPIFFLSRSLKIDVIGAVFTQWKDSDFGLWCGIWVWREFLLIQKHKVSHTCDKLYLDFWKEGGGNYFWYVIISNQVFDKMLENSSCGQSITMH